MICKNCGAEISDTAKFCTECGASVTEETTAPKTISYETTFVQEPAPEKEKTPRGLKTWRLVSGILTLVFAALALFQSCAAGVSNALTDSNDLGGSAGLLVSLLMIAGGIVSIAARQGKRGSNIAIAILFGLAALLGTTNTAVFADLKVWAAWCLICCVIAIYAAARGK